MKDERNKGYKDFQSRNEKIDKWIARILAALVVAELLAIAYIVLVVKPK